MIHMRSVIETLKDDHARLRRMLDVFEHALNRDDGQPNETLDSLLSRLEEELEAHIKREEVLLPFLYSVTKGGLKRYHEERDHTDIRTTIHLLRDLLSEEHSISLGVIDAYGSHLMDTLREHMEEEEKSVFPIAERALSPVLLEDITHLIEVGVEPSGAA